jgi:hypothetical protein
MRLVKDEVSEMFNLLGKQNLNVEYKGVRINDVCEKIGSIISPEAREFGKKLDDLTKKITVKIDD